MRGGKPTEISRNGQAMNELTLSEIERQYKAGLTSAQILELLAKHGVAFSEATLRKYIQLGLLPRSVRVGRKGKHQGSQGIYPVGVLRQIFRIKKMMAESFTIEQIQREFLFMRGDLEQLEHTLDGLFQKLDAVLKAHKQERTARSVARDVSEARNIGRDLLARLVAIETRLTSPARLEHVAAS
jgi:DNA-binding transcriptional MerR regulator